MAVIRTGIMVFDEAADVVVIGAGACGLAAALAACDGGAEVLVLEREASPTGMTSLSQGFCCAAGTGAQRAAGVADDADAFFADIIAKTRGQTDRQLARCLARESGPMIDWLAEQHGVELTVDPAWRGDFGHSRPRLHGPAGRTGPALHEMLLAAVARAGIPVRTDSAVVDIYADPDGRILGVGIELADGLTETIECRALVLATGGFAANPEMIGRFIPEIAEKPVFTHAGSDGGGIAWGIELGAATADMGAFQGHGAFSAETRMAVAYNIVMQGGFEVNALGERFSNELADISGQAMHVLRQPGGIAWMIYDEHLHRDAMRWPQYCQLTDINAMVSAPDEAALAAIIGVPAEALAATMRGVAAMVEGANDPLGRVFANQHSLAAPFFAIKVTGALFHTQGGLVVDENAQVRRIDGALMPNLFAGGGAARSVSGPGVWGYLPAMGLCMSMTLGRLAGRQAARLTSDE